MKRQNVFCVVAISTFLGLAGPAAGADVNVSVVALLSPSPSDTTNTLPSSVLSVPKGQDYYVEVWASDVGTTNTGLTSVYTDVAFTPSSAASVQSINHGGIFTVFASGTVVSGGIDELGGSSLTGAGVEPQWARVATIRMRADAAGTVSFSLAASTTGVAALGRGLIPWSQVSLGNVAFEQVQCPSITQHPLSQAICEGGPVTFTVSATGTAPLSYQWRKNSSNIPGATSSSYTINPVASGNAGNYSCVVTNACGSVTSSAATLTVNTAPVITGNPDSQAVCEGGSATFSVTAAGAGPISYQWRKNGSNIPGATSSSYTINPVGSGDVAGYDCVITNTCGSSTSNTAVLSLKAPVAITDDPDSQTLCEGGTVTFTVSASGTAPLSYRWRKNGSNIAGATSSSYTINPVGSAHAGSYDCVVTNACGSATSSSATLTVHTAPVITVHPANRAVCEGGSATFSVTAAGTAPLSYKWRKNGSVIPGATSASYTINPVSSSDGGSYDCVVSNGCGSATSNAATLTVNTPPVITDNPDNKTVCEGDSATFSVSASSTTPLSYQWRKNGSTIPGATNSSYTISPVGSSNSGSYDCVVTNTCGSATSDAATLTVSTAPVITDDPDNQAVCEGSAVTFTVSASGTAPLSYRWRKDGANIPGATSSSYTIDPVAPFDAGRYDCVVTNTCGSAISNAASLTTNTAPVITGYPENQAVCEGGLATFTVSATGTGPLSYQWRKNGSNIAGATSATYTINPVAAGDAGGYDCVITNTCGTAISNTAALTVGAGPVVTDDPDGQTVCEGDVAIFSVSATGTPPLSYQWRKNGSNIPGATTSTYVIFPVAAGDAGNYQCVVTNSCGSDTSGSAILTVNAPPVITDDPDNQTVCEGGSATLIVSATGTGSLSYQWRKNGSNISGATGSSYTINPAAAGDGGIYQCIVSNSCDSIISAAAIVTVSTAPTITSQPADQVVCEGGSAAFTVSASSAGPLSYQWRKNGSNIPGATSPSYTVNPVSTGDAGNYTCVVTNTCGSATSSAASLTVGTVPVVTDDPDSQTVCEGDVAIFSVSATGTPPPSYQWRKNGSNIPGATSFTYVIFPVTAGDGGNYQCVVTNSCGSDTSSVATLTVNTPPVITGNPSSKTLCEGGAVTFVVSATGTGPLSYQWRRNGITIPGATSSSYTINPVGAGNAGSYQCVVTNSCSLAISNEAILTVNTVPVIMSDPVNQTACEGGSITFTVSATGTGPLSYQWRKNGSSIPGATSPSYTINPVASGNAGNYSCVVTNACGSVTSSAATLTVNTAPVITGNPDSQAVCEGGSATFSVTAAGAGPISYQWRKNGSNIPGATNSTYVISAVATGDAGSYDCLVTNNCGSATSDAAILTVTTPPVITDDPDNRVLCEGGSVTFTVSAGGTGPFSYKWRKNGIAIPGATSSSYTISPAGSGDAANYECVVANSCGSAISNAATLTVNTAPAIVHDPGNQAVCVGSSTTFSVAATGTGPLSYQWRKNGSSIPGATSSSYTINPVASGNAGNYDCVVTNTCGSATSNTAALTVKTAPVIIADPDSRTADEGGSAVFSVTATGAEPLSYQWRKNGIAIPDAICAIYMIYPVASEDAGNYECVVTNSCGSVVSKSAALTVGEAPVIISGPSPASLTICDGDSKEYCVSATGTGLLSYQWQRNGSDIVGATASCYLATAAGSYRCVVRDDCGYAISSAATLTVNSAPAITQDPRQSPSPACEGSRVTFTVKAAGVLPLHYQWKVDGANVGDDAPQLILDGIQLSDHGAQVTCEVGNDCGNVTGTALSIVVSECVTIYVDEDASGANNGASWDDAFNYLQDALDLAAASSGATTQICVAGGTYWPDLGQYHTAGERAGTFQLINGVAVKGGYAGAGEPDSNARDTQLYETVLSGDTGKVYDNSDNSYHVVTGSGTDNTAILDGFVITGGNADVPGHSDGGGMYNDGGSPTIASCVFRYNVAGNGAGIANTGGSPVVTNCIFSGNSAGISGGGIYNVNYSHSTIANCTLSRNSAGSLGGGIYNLLSNPVVTNSILWSNSEGGITDELAQIHTVGGSPVVNYSCIHGLTGSLGGTGNIGEDPCFADAADDDYHLKSVGWRWNPITRSWDFDRRATSRCIDAGNPGSPLRNELLPDDIDPSLPDIAMNIRVNMGAYGGTAQASLAPPGWALLPDADNSGVVDFGDYASVEDLWLDSGKEQPFDFDRSGDVDYKDVVLFVEDWLNQTSWFRP